MRVLCAVGRRPVLAAAGDSTTHRAAETGRRRSHEQAELSPELSRVPTFWARELFWLLLVLRSEMGWGVVVFTFRPCCHRLGAPGDPGVIVPFPLTVVVKPTRLVAGMSVERRSR